MKSKNFMYVNTILIIYLLIDIKIILRRQIKYNYNNMWLCEYNYKALLTGKFVACKTHTNIYIQVCVSVYMCVVVHLSFFNLVLS